MAAVRAAPAEAPLPRVLEDAVRHTLTPGLGVSAGLLGLGAHPDPAGRGEPRPAPGVGGDLPASERSLAEVLAERLTAAHVPYDADNVADRTRLCFTAAVASAAVRTASGELGGGRRPRRGPRGPAELAVANLVALRDFAWGA
ncbi:hypothetical protein GCM10023238_15570 [Streptomyces heliomycini]